MIHVINSGAAQLSKINDGDIFRWSYCGLGNPGMPNAELVYWAKSQIAVAKNGVLRDTFWGDMSEGTCFSLADVGTRIDLELIANFSDLHKTPEVMEKYYDPADCINLNHSNSTSGNFYIRIGAKRSKEKMLATIDEGIRKAYSDKRRAEIDIKNFANQRSLIESGSDLNDIWI